MKFGIALALMMWGVSALAEANIVPPDPQKNPEVKALVPRSDDPARGLVPPDPQKNPEIRPLIPRSQGHTVQGIVPPAAPAPVSTTPPVVGRPANDRTPAAPPVGILPPSASPAPGNPHHPIQHLTPRRSGAPGHR